MASTTWLATDKAPYVVTLLAAALGWTLQRAATVLTDAPTIAYSVDNGNKGEVIATIENISRTQQFHDLRFHLQTQKDDVFEKSGHVVKPFAPAMQPSGSFSPESSDRSDDVSYPIPVMQPGWKFDLCAKRKSSDPAVLTVEFDRPLPSESGHVDSTGTQQAVRMVKRGFTTWIAKNEILFLFYLIGFWLAAMILSLRLFAVKPQEGRS